MIAPEPTTEPPRTVSINLRFDESLHQLLVAAAKGSVRSLNGEIIFRLRQSLCNRQVESGDA